MHKEMNRFLYLIHALMLGAAACSDDDGGTTLPELPDGDMNINVPAVPADWAPGMAYKPYDTIVPETGTKVKVTVVGENEKTQAQMEDVVNNEAWVWEFGKYASSDNVVKVEKKQLCFFPNHPDVSTSGANAEEGFAPAAPADVVVMGFPVYRLDEAIRNMEVLENTFSDGYPLVVASAGDNKNAVFGQAAWDLCIRIGGLDWEEDVVPYFGWEDWKTWSKPWDDEKSAYYYPGNVGAAYAVQNINTCNHVEDWIVVGRADGTGNRPGPVLKDRWICAPYAFNVKDMQVQNTPCGAAYVAKIAAEIKRRTGWANEKIAELIFSTAENLGDAEIYGHGVIDPEAIWNALKKQNL